MTIHLSATALVKLTASRLKAGQTTPTTKRCSIFYRSSTLCVSPRTFDEFSVFVASSDISNAPVGNFQFLMQFVHLRYLGLNGKMGTERSSFASYASVIVEQEDLAISWLWLRQAIDTMHPRRTGMPGFCPHSDQRLLVPASPIYHPFLIFQYPEQVNSLILNGEIYEPL